MLYNAMLEIKWLDYLECIILQPVFQLLHWNQSVIQRRQNPFMVDLKLNSEENFTSFFQSVVMMLEFETIETVAKRKIYGPSVKYSVFCNRGHRPLTCLLSDFMSSTIKSWSLSLVLINLGSMINWMAREIWYRFQPSNHSIQHWQSEELPEKICIWIILL